MELGATRGFDAPQPFHLEHHPRGVDLILSLGSGYGRLLNRVREGYPNFWTAPPIARALVTAYAERNMSLFAAAERLGWQPSDEEN